MNDATSWDEVRRRINGLWPRYEPTPEERELTVRRLSALNQRWLAVAVDDYRASNGSTVFRLAELLDHYRRIANAGEEREAARTTPKPKAQRDDWTQQRARDHAAALAELARMDRARIGRAVQSLRSRGWISASPLPANLNEWPISSVLFVHAALTVGTIEAAAGDSAAGSASRTRLECSE